ncbi:MAG: aldose 1-epimerase [Acidimicrobiia bacterium]|jgi:aldose 1-epimerase
MPSAMATLESGSAELSIDLEAGARIASLRVHGHELLVTSGPGPIEWGCYPMAPFAGRVRSGRFRFGGVEHRLPRNLGDHAIHGTVFTRRWEPDAGGGWVCPLGDDWPFSGYARQMVELGEDSVDLRLEVHADEPMPASVGWHPWFRRPVGGAAARVELTAGHMYRRDPDGVAGRERVPVPAGPWDDCFGDLTGPPAVSWQGVLRLELASTCPYVVVFDERDHAVCVEPQTAPPDAFNHDDGALVEPGRPLVATSRWTWEGRG